MRQIQHPGNSRSMNRDPQIRTCFISAVASANGLSPTLLPGDSPVDLICRAAGLGPEAGPVLLPDASRTFAARPDCGPYRQVDQSPVTVYAVRPEIDSFTAMPRW
jgi:hypothetical protein